MVEPQQDQDKPSGADFAAKMHALAEGDAAVRRAIDDPAALTEHLGDLAKRPFGETEDFLAKVRDRR